MGAKRMEKASIPAQDQDRATKDADRKDPILRQLEKLKMGDFVFAGQGLQRARARSLRSYSR
jgi:hypothetical protein